MSKKSLNKERHNIALLILILIYVFLLSPFQQGEARQIVYSIILTSIYIIVVYAIKKKSNFYFYLSGIVIVLEWVTDFYKLTYISWLATAFSLLFFILAIVKMVIRIAGSKKVGTLEFLEAINIYFLFGILGSILFHMLYDITPNAFIFPEGLIPSRTDFIYYSFVTISTLGYGDIIPVSSMAKNFSIFLSITGQLYLAMIVALLVGKYLTSASNQHQKNSI